MKLLEVRLYSVGVTQIPCDTLVVPLPSDERPLREEAGLIDWRVCGAISEHLLSGYVSAEPGEVVLLPAPRPLAASRLLLVGLGPRERMQGKGLQRAFSLACEKILSLRAGLGLVALPGAIDFALDAPPILRGCFAALARVRGDGRLRIAFASGLSRARTLEAALAGLGTVAPEKGVEISLVWPEAELQPGGAPSP